MPRTRSTRPQLNPTPALTPDRHFCIRCGLQDGSTRPKGISGAGTVVIFRSIQAIKCDLCVEETEEARELYARIYHRARGRAVRKLIKAHAREFEKLLVAERTILAEELARLKAGEDAGDADEESEVA